MDRVLFVVANGGKQIMHAQTLNAHNLANANTVGFQQDLANFSSQMIDGAGFDSRAFSTAEDAGVSFDKGDMQRTGRTLDVAVNGNGWLAVQSPDGSEAYTRAGNLKVNINGQLVTGANHPVLGDSGPIVVPEHEKIDDRSRSEGHRSRGDATPGKRSDHERRLRRANERLQRSGRLRNRLSHGLADVRRRSRDLRPRSRR